MHLWNDYEGKTLAGTFPIEALLRTEGRNACFATHDRDGRPAVLRLTEALNDQTEMRARFAAVRDMGQRNLVSIADFGDVEIEGTPLIYLVMEPTQESLADIIRERRLSIEETGEVALSLVAALEALHVHGLIHGLVEPASVLAAGQVIKLRSDCVRPAPPGADGVRARAEDVFGLADVLHRSLTQQRLEDASDALALPEPYASIARHAVRGTWGIDEVAAEVRRSIRGAAAQPAAPAAQPPLKTVAAASNPVAAGPAIAAGMAARAAVREELLPPPSAGRSAAQAASADPAQLPIVFAQSAQQDEKDPAANDRWRKPLASKAERSPMMWLAGAAGLCLLVFGLWHFAGTGSPGNEARAGVANAAGFPAAANLPAPAPVPVPAHNMPAPTAPRALLKPPAAAVTAPQKGQVWRVVAYTYNVEVQAKAKARLIAERHAELDPQVFSRTGHAPFLVTLGGALSEQEAATMRERARNDGLARDVYMQNYSR